jgi:hypothetical protein
MILVLVRYHQAVQALHADRPQIRNDS